MTTDFNIYSTIDEELLKELKKLSELDPGSDEAKELMKNITILHQMRMKEKDVHTKCEEIEIDKHLDHRKLDLEERKIDLENKREQVKARDARIFQILGVGVTVGTFVIGWGFRSKWLAKGFKFEESGTFASKTMMECFKEVFKKN